MVSITNADLEIYVTENSVTTVIWKDNARVLAFGDVVRITDRDGIRYEFLYTDVIAPTSPAYSSAEELADEINTYLITIPGGGGGGTITDVTATAPLTSSGGATPDISTLMSSGKLIGRHSSGSGVFQEITLGTNLSLSGDTLNAAGGGGGGLLSGNATQVSAGVYTASITGVTAYSAGDAYLIKFDTANDGACTININALGAKNIFKNTAVPIASGDIKANQEIMIVYDGTNFQAIGLIASQLLAYVHNAEGAVINKGQVVYAHEASGNKMSVKLARANSDLTSAKTIGLVYDSSIGIGGEGYIIIQGVIEGINTAAFNAGDTLYLSGSTFGGVTATKPYAPTHLVYVGIVERANAGNGQIYVRCQNGYELDEIHDVDLVTNPPVFGDVLTYTGGTQSLWEARTIAQILGYTPGGELTIQQNGSPIDTNVTTIDFLSPLQATQTVAGQVEIGLQGGAITGAMYELAAREALQNSRCIILANGKLWIPSNTANNVRVFDATTLELLATISVTTPLECTYIQSLDQIWVANGVSGQITRINATANTVLGTIADLQQSKRQFIEYPNPVTGNPRVYIITSANAAPIAGSCIRVYDLTTLTLITTINLTTGDSTLRGVLIDNASSAMDKKIVLCTFAGTIGLRILNPETNTITASSIVPTGLTGTDTPVCIDYNSSLDQLAVGYLTGSAIAILTPATATTFTTDLVVKQITGVRDVRYDPANNLLLYTSQAGFSTGTNLQFCKMDDATYTYQGALWTSFTGNNPSGPCIAVLGGGIAAATGCNTTAGTSFFSLIRYA